MGVLYLVATPIGNLEDVTLRALRVLAEVSVVAAEDTRTTRKLLTHHGIPGTGPSGRARLLSYNEHNMKGRTPQLLAALQTGDVAFASEAGTPGVSDPGFELARAAIAAGHRVVAVPGASALLTALSASGLPMREFTFLGFLPRRSSERRKLFESLKGERRTLVAFESPHRVRASLEDVLAVLGDRHIAACRELTKLHEEVFRGCVAEAIEHFAEPRGEFTLVVDGATVGAQRAAPSLSEAQIRAQLARLRSAGVKGREAARRVSAETGWPQRDVYRLWTELGNRVPPG
ncbi:MAG TPA: 16S rRNA (cytidine(1402)-2'-O)-methyltransferase [Dehalococcoidia bacterium]|nr:16S rRNA (cytidine(1402)-2'-O)-methyltransferase [Dehalococcoidia bacterium]